MWWSYNYFGHKDGVRLKICNDGAMFPLNKKSRDFFSISSIFHLLLWFSRSVVYISLRLHGLQHDRLPCPSPSPRICSNSCPLNQWFHPTISSYVVLLLPSIFPSIRVFYKESVLPIRWPKYWSFSFSISPSSEYSGLISLGLTGLISLQSPRDSQESSLTPQFKSINSLVLSLLYGPTHTSIHDYWKNHSLDYTDLCWQSNVSAF